MPLHFVLCFLVCLASREVKLSMLWYFTLCIIHSEPCLSSGTGTARSRALYHCVQQFQSSEHEESVWLFTAPSSYIASCFFIADLIAGSKSMLFRRRSQGFWIRVIFRRSLQNFGMVSMQVLKKAWSSYTFEFNPLEIRHSFRFQLVCV